MASMTISTSAENFTRVVSALDRQRSRLEEGETDGDFYKRWLRDVHTDLVHGAERRVAEETVEMDEDIAEIT